MRSPRLKTRLWVQLQQQQCKRLNLPLYVLHKGEESAGSVILKINLMDGRCKLYTQVTDMDGDAAWQARSADGAPVPEEDAAAYIARQRDFDPDLWGIEIEDPKGNFELDRPVI